MKKLFSILILALSTNIFAQQTHIPDQNFEQALIYFGLDDTLDTQSYTVSANTITITESDGETNEAMYTVSKTNLSITIVDSETETVMMGVTNVMNYEMTINCTRQ